jgi:micrococcal nuclease
MRIKPFNIILVFLFTFLLSSYIYLISFYYSHQNNPSSQSEVAKVSESIKSTEKVVRVIDGDTFVIEGDIRVRLIGMDTPEMKNKNKTIDCFAQEATNKLTSLISGKGVVLVKDVSETDKYGRLLRYVYLGDEMINDTLVKEGYARIATFPPDVKYVNQFLQSEKLAREGNLGLWSKCK